MRPDVYKISNLLNDMKLKFGIPQTKIAEILGVSAQALTDIKNERRRVFTPDMAGKLLDAYKNEPWAGWLAEALKATLASKGTSVPARAALDTTISEAPHALLSDTMVQIPLLLAPHVGPPRTAATYGKVDVFIPKWASTLISASTDPYVLELAADDYAGRLRMGDHVLIVQDVLPNKEIMVVECAGGLRLARNAKHMAVNENGDADWIVLDSGAGMHAARPVATVMGIIKAVL